MSNESETKLFRLSELKDFKVAKNEPDVRGWQVVGQDGQDLGSVYDLIVDPELMKVRYLQLKLDKELYVSKADRYVLIPIGRAKLRRAERQIFIQHLDRSHIRFYPIYRGEAITREYEYGLREALREENAEKNIYEEQNRYGEAYEDVRSRYAGEAESDDPVVRMRAERDIARAEKDILKAENEVLKMQLRNIRKALDENFYEHEHFDDRSFYEAHPDQKEPPNHGEPMEEKENR